jgi:hypothetical protein
LKIYTLLLCVVYSHEDLDVLLNQNDLSYLLNPIQHLENSLPVVKSEVNYGNTKSIEKIKQLYKLNSGCTYDELYDRTILAYFKIKFDKLLFSCCDTNTIPNTTIYNKFFNKFKTYYFQCNKNDRTIRKLANQFNLTRYRSEQYIKQCIS